MLGALRPEVSMSADASLSLGHPHLRPRRLRQSQAIRTLVEEHELSPKDFIAPLFVSERSTIPEEIPSLPGVSRLPLEHVLRECESLLQLGIRAVMLFPVVMPEKKDLLGSESSNPEGIAQRTARTLKDRFPELLLFGDVALDPFTIHGHDGITDAMGEVENDPTVAALCKQALSLAKAGIDFVAPSDMMDGRIGAIRSALDAAGLQRTGILAYTAKYASAFYGPFREALASGARGLDKRGYQLSTPNQREALREAALDEAEGADMMMVKPALPYLDVLTRLRARTLLPLVAYHVSGEYAQLKAAAERNWLDEEAAVREVLLSIKRAGADLIVTYYARWACERLFR